MYYEQKRFFNICFDSNYINLNYTSSYFGNSLNKSYIKRAT